MKSKIISTPNEYEVTFTESERKSVLQAIDDLKVFRGLEYLILNKLKEVI